MIARIEHYDGHVTMSYPMKNESDKQFIIRLNNNFSNRVRRIKFIEPIDKFYNKR